MRADAHLVLMSEDPEKRPMAAAARALARDLAERPGLALARARAHRFGLALTLAGLLGLSAFGLMAPATALAGFLLALAASALLPVDPEGTPAGTDRASTTSLTPRPLHPMPTGAGWRALVEAIPDAAIALDDEGRILHHNALAAEIFPKLRAELPLSQVTRSPELIEAVDRIETASEPIVVQMLEWVPVERRVQATVSRLSRTHADTGLPSRLVTFRDLSEQDRLAQMRADFIANASHELRTPLASLRGFVETLQGPAREDPKARDRFLGLMAAQATRMTRLIDDLLSLSRVEMRVHLQPRGVVDLGEVAAHVTQTLEPLAAASRTVLTLHRPDGPARVRGDRDEIVQVVVNLVQNALKYGHENGHVEIRISRRPAHRDQPAELHLAVRDDGPGIAPEHLPRLTERFYRVNVASSREKGGTGLGLAIVKHIVNRHRGELRIASTPGQGSTFTLVLHEHRPATASDGRQ